MVSCSEVLPANLRESYYIINNNNNHRDEDSESRYSSLRSKRKEEQQARRMRDSKIMSETWLCTGRFILSVFIFNCLLVLQVVVDTSRLVNSFRLSSWRTKRRRRLRGNEEKKKPINYYSTSSIRLSASLASIILLVLCKLLSAQASMLATDDSLDPQPLIYLPAREIGSGMGPTSSSSSGWPAGLKQQQQQQGMSSSSPPALITAKCWNNYQTDEDCRHIQVITSDQQNSALPTSADSSVDSNMIISSNNNNDDDSLISPVLLLESSSTLEPSSAIDGGNSQSQPAFLAPPYFSAPSPDRSPQFVDQTNRQPDAVNQPPHQKHRVFFNHRHHQQPPSTPPTANDLFAAPPAGATLLPPTHTYNTATHLTEPHRHLPASVGAGFVATPNPRKPPKSTTAGRKCRDENDADCDEPEENEGTGSDGADEDADDDADENEGVENSGSRTIGVKLQSSGTQTIGDEIGSGSEPEDDNESDDDDDSELESSGAFVENSPSSSSSSSPSYNVDGQFVQITSTSRSEAESVSPAGAEIEVVVHPTLPPSFPSSSSQPSWPAKSSEETQVSPSAAHGPIGSTLPTSTSTASTTAMPDDTFKSKPVFPPDEGAISISQIDGDFGSEHQENSAVSENIDNIDLATFKPVPMPAADPQLQQARRPVDTFHNFRSASPSSGVSSQQSSTSERINENSEGQNKLADRHRIDFNTPLPEVAQPATPSQQPAARPFDSPWREKSWRGQQFSGSPNAEQPSWRLNKADEVADRRMLLAQQVSPSTPQQLQPEMLPTLLLYASIIILVVTASIFIIMAFVFWRRNSIRQKALLSSKTALLNGSGVIGGFGAGGVAGMMPNQMQQQHLVGVQQPGLLSTYVPGKGFSSKLTGGLVKEDPQEMVAEDQEGEDEDDDEEEGEEEDEVGEEEDDEEISFSNENSKDPVQQALQPIPANQQQQQQQRTLHRPSQQSWSTDDNPTSSSAGSSQRTIDSQQAAPVSSMQQIGGRGSAIPQNGRQHYVNSNGNSGSISDWQGSPVDPMQVPYPTRPIPPLNAPLYLPQISDNGQLYRQANQFPNPMIVHQQQHHPQQIPVYPDQYYTQQPVPLQRQHIQNGFAPPVIPAAVNKGFNSYHSVEELDNPHQMNYNHSALPNGPPVRMSRRI